MKTFEVELKRTAYVTIQVEAGSTEEAEFIAWQEIENGYGDKGDASWEVESIEEMK
jgi:hypothetical protein